MPEVHVTHRTGRDGSSSHHRNHSGGKRKKFRKPRGNFNNKGKGISKPKNNNGNKACFKCGCHDHFAKKCKTPQHLVDLYQKSIGNGQKVQGKKYEVHFVTHEHEAGTSAPDSNGAEPSETKTLHQGETSSGDDKMIMEYESNDIFRDLN